MALLFGYSLAIFKFGLWEMPDKNCMLRFVLAEGLHQSSGVSFLEQFQNKHNNSPLGCTLEFPKPLHAHYLIFIKHASRADIRISSILQVRKLGFRSVKQKTWYCTVNCTTEIWTFPFQPLTVDSSYLVMCREPPSGMSSIWHYVKSLQKHCGSWSSEIFLPIIIIGILLSRTTKVLAICIKLVVGPCLHPHFSLHQVFSDSSLSLSFA